MIAHVQADEVTDASAHLNATFNVFLIALSGTNVAQFHLRQKTRCLSVAPKSKKTPKVPFPFHDQKIKKTMVRTYKLLNSLVP